MGFFSELKEDLSQAALSNAKELMQQASRIKQMEIPQ